MPFLKRFISSFAQSPKTRGLPIIGTLLLSLSMAGCSAVRLGYENAASLTYWWLDGYADFDGPQATRVRADLDELLRWHRRQELPAIAELLATTRTAAKANTSAAEVCALVDSVQARTQALLERTAPLLAGIAPTLTEQQIRHTADAFKKGNREWERDYLEGSDADRLERRVARSVERLESFYGPLSSVQTGMVRAQAQASVFDAAAAYQERQRRQTETLEVLGRLRTAQLTASEAKMAARTLLLHSLTSPDAGYRQYAARLSEQGCASMAALHNSTNETQRARLARTLQGYESDARALTLPP